jgi:hypothetical protein
MVLLFLRPFLLLLLPIPEKNMSPLSPVRKCAHPGCQCLVSENTEYCSDYCKLAGEEEYCGCGHTGCNTQFAQTASPQKAA